MTKNVQRRLAAILAADVVGYSRLMGEDEAGTLGALHSHRDKVIEPKVAEHEGRIVKFMGDGVLAEFPSAVEAVQCAIEIQQTMAEWNADVPEDRRIVYRIGINIGDIIAEGDDIYGDGVNLAARLESLAPPNGICVSDMVYQGIHGKLDIAFEDLGEQAVKNIAKPIQAYRIAPARHRHGGAPTGSSTNQARWRWVLGTAIFGLFAAGSLLAWTMFDWEASGSSRAACTDHLGLPVPADRCPEDQP